MKQYETQPLVLDVCSQVRLIRPQELLAGRRMLGWWHGESWAG